jgi:hypothetical protein
MHNHFVEDYDPTIEGKLRRDFPDKRKFGSAGNERGAEA